MFSIISGFGIQHILSTSSKKNLFLVLLLAGIILLSYNMLRERNDMDLELLQEKETFGKFVANTFKGKIMGDLYTQISHNLPNAEIASEKGEKVLNDRLILVGFGPPAKTIFDVMKYAEQNNVTYLVIDDIYESRSPQLIEIFYNEEEYPNLRKVFDSAENGYRKLHVKIFEIDHNKLE